MCDVINSEIFMQFSETKVETNTLHFLATLRCSLNENERQSATVLRETQSIAAAIKCSGNLILIYLVYTKSNVYLLSKDVDPCKKQIEPSNRDTKRSD